MYVFVCVCMCVFNSCTTYVLFTIYINIKNYPYSILSENSLFFNLLISRLVIIKSVIIIIWVII